MAAIASLRVVCAVRAPKVRAAAEVGLAAFHSRYCVASKTPIGNKTQKPIEVTDLTPGRVWFKTPADDIHVTNSTPGSECNPT
jgi:hypothetical protein